MNVLITLLVATLTQVCGQVVDPTCVDKKDCSLYTESVCEGTYKAFAELNCRQYCGFCVGPTTTTTQATTTTVPYEKCVDKVDCASYGDFVCTSKSYIPWATDNCPNYCNFCVGPTTPAPPCVDVADNCNSFDASVCTNDAYKGWAQDNCRRWCGLCTYTGPTTAPTTPTTPPTTTPLPPQLCVDKISNCKAFGDYSCRGSYEPWARNNCPKTCGFCQGVPEPPIPCVDRIDNCNWYDESVCKEQSYRGWAENNCRKYCGLCQDGSSNVTTPTPKESDEVCEYKGQKYKHGEVWSDGCELVCKCIDARIKQHLCKDRCPKWNLGPGCSYINVPGQCCPKVRCGNPDDVVG